MSKRKNILQKISLFVLAFILCFGLMSCKSNDEKDSLATDDETIDSSEDSSLTLVTEKQESALDAAIQPINDIEVINDKSVAESIVKDLTEVGELEADSSQTGVSLIVKHDGTLKEMPLEYPFINWLSEQKKPVLIEFVADYSEPSKKSLPYLNALAEEYADKMLVCKVDVEATPKFVDTFELEYLPTYYLSKDLTLYILETGFDPFAEPTVIDNIEQVLNEE